MKAAPGLGSGRCRVAVGLVFTMLVLFSTASAAFKTLQEGMTVPEVGGKDLVSGERISWKPGGGAEDSGAAMIVFWATWSPRSVELLKDLVGMAEKYRDHELRIIGVNVEGQRVDADVKRRVIALVRDLAPPFPVVMDEDLKIFDSYGVIAVPSVAVVDGSGVLRYGPAGYSYLVRDGLVDSTEVILGLKESSPTLVQGYRPDTGAGRLYNLGQQLAGKGLYKQALENLERSIAADTLFSAPFNLRGQIHLSLEDFAAAMASFARAVELDSTSVAARTGRGRACFGLKLYAEAMADFAAAKSLDETYTPALLGLAECHMRRGEYDLALPLLEAARELNARDPELLFCLGRYCRATGDEAGAVAALRGAIEQMVTLPALRAGAVD